MKLCLELHSRAEESFVYGLPNTDDDISIVAHVAVAGQCGRGGNVDLDKNFPSYLKHPNLSCDQHSYSRIVTKAQRSRVQATAPSPCQFSF